MPINQYTKALTRKSKPVSPLPREHPPGVRMQAAPVRIHLRAARLNAFLMIMKVYGRSFRIIVSELYEEASELYGRKGSRN